MVTQADDDTTDLGPSLEIQEQGELLITCALSIVCVLRPGLTVVLLGIYTAVQIQKAVSAYFTSTQILPFGFAEQYRLI